MARTTDADVRYMFDNNLDPEKTLDPIINDASIYIDKVESYYDDATLEIMEKYLACHMISMSFYRQETMDRRSGESANYTGSFSQGLKSTTYGQYLLNLDTENALENLNKRKVNFYFV